MEAVYPGHFVSPMMVICLHKETYNPYTERGLEDGQIITFASPELIKAYTGFDLFDSSCSFYFDDRVLDIEFEWVIKSYPYLHIRLGHIRDYIETEKYRIPEIKSINEVVLEW